MDELKHFPPRDILAPTDLSDVSRTALAYAGLFRERFGSRITVLHADTLEAPPYFTRDQADELLARARALREVALEHVTREAESVLGFRPSAKVVEGPAPRAILMAAEEAAFDLIVMGAHGRGAVESLFMGSVTERVVRQARIPVLATPLRKAAPFRHILGTPDPVSHRYTAALAESFGARLSLVPEAELKHAEIAEDVDLVVMGNERGPSLWGELVGSTTARALRVFQKPLLTIPNVTKENEP